MPMCMFRYFSWRYGVHGETLGFEDFVKSLGFEGSHSYLHTFFSQIQEVFCETTLSVKDLFKAPRGLVHTYADMEGFRQELTSLRIWGTIL